MECLRAETLIVAVEMVFQRMTEWDVENCRWGVNEWVDVGNNEDVFAELYKNC